MAKPTTAIPDWASDATYTAGIETGLAPTLSMSASEVSQGVRPGKFVARKFNWLTRLITSWLKHIEESRPDFVAGDSVYQAGNVTLNCAPGIALSLTGGSSTDFSVDRVFTCTQAAECTSMLHVRGKLTATEDAEIVGDLQVDEDVIVSGNLSAASLSSSTSVDAAGNLFSAGLLATGIVEVEVPESTDYTIVKATTCVQTVGAGGKVLLPAIPAVLQKQYDLCVLNLTGSALPIYLNSGAEAVASTDAGTACLVHWTGSHWAYVKNIGSAGLFHPMGG